MTTLLINGNDLTLEELRQVTANLLASAHSCCTSRAVGVAGIDDDCSDVVMALDERSTPNLDGCGGDEVLGKERCSAGRSVGENERKVGLAAGLDARSDRREFETFGKENLPRFGHIWSFTRKFAGSGRIANLGNSPLTMATSSQQ